MGLLVISIIDYNYGYRDSILNHPLLLHSNLFKILGNNPVKILVIKFSSLDAIYTD